MAELREQPTLDQVRQTSKHLAVIMFEKVVIPKWRLIVPKAFVRLHSMIRDFVSRD